MRYSDLYNEAKKEGRTRTVTPTFFEFKEKGDAIIGKLVGYSPVPSSLGEGSYNQYVLETDNGLVKFACGQATDKEIIHNLHIGHVYCFQFDEKLQIAKGRSVNKFLVTTFDLPEDGGVGGPDDVPF